MTMAERPILFSAPMVRAILAGTKTQTRRAIKLPHANPLGQWEALPWGGPNGGRTQAGDTIPAQMVIGHSRTGEVIGCPYGQPGDRLWVRESFQPFLAAGVEHCDADWKTGKGYAVGYVATDGRADWIDSDDNVGDAVKPSIHMPRWASRITLEITGVRVERLQDISEQDAQAEGIVRHLDGHGWHTEEGRHYMGSPQLAYAALWEQINGAGAWEANPWVWVVEFKRLERDRGNEK
jgi:hypothetical protein